MEIVCPSGLSGKIRKLKGAEANVLSDREAVKKGEVYNKILAQCWEETLDPGVYDAQIAPAGTATPQWDKVLVCDRFYALTCIRIATYGSEFLFPAQCPVSLCGARFEWGIDLSKDLPVLDLPDESREAIRNGENRFETSCAGEPVFFKLMNGADEKRTGKRALQNKSELVTVALGARILQVGGMTDKRKIDEWLKATDLDLQWDLLKQFEAVDGGIDQKIEIECPECYKGFDVTLPFEGEGFWIPSTRKSRSKDRTTTRKTRTIGGAVEEDDTEES